MLCQTVSLKPFSEVKPSFFAVMSCSTIEVICSSVHLVLTRGVDSRDVLGVLAEVDPGLFLFLELIVIAEVVDQQGGALA